jgi:hypothetical protein
VSETALEGGDVNVGERVVVRVGDTVRRAMGRHSPAVHALLGHLEREGFNGAPRVLGVDERGREILSYVEGEPGLPPVPAADAVLFDLGRLLRAMHDAQTGFAPAPDAMWQDTPLRPPAGPVVCHLDLYPPNVVFRGGVPVALIDWDFAAPADPLFDIASAAKHWAPLAQDERARRFGLPPDRRGERLRLLCDGYGLGDDERLRLLDVVEMSNQMGYETHRLLGGERRLPGWREMWDAGSGAELRDRIVWFEAHRPDLLRYLT